MDILKSNTSQNEHIYSNVFYTTTDIILDISNWIVDIYNDRKIKYFIRKITEYSSNLTKIFHEVISMWID